MASATTGPSRSIVEDSPRSGEAYLPSAEPLQLVAPWFPVDLAVGGKVEHWRFVEIRHPYERYRHVSQVPAGAPVLLQPQLGDPPGHRVLAALSLIDEVEPTASLTPSHESLARLADPDRVAAVAGECDGLGLPPRVPARLRSLHSFREVEVASWPPNTRLALRSLASRASRRLRTPRRTSGASHTVYSPPSSSLVFSGSLTSSPINDITNKALEVLSEKHQARDRALQLSREVVQLRQRHSRRPPQRAGANADPGPGCGRQGG